MNAAIRSSDIAEHHSSMYSKELVAPPCLRCDSFRPQLVSSRRSHNQLDTRSAAWLSLWITLRLPLPLVPTAAISLHRDCEKKPHFDWEYPCVPPLLTALLHELCILGFLHLDFQGTDNWIVMSFFAPWDHTTMSGHMVVCTILGITFLA